MAWALLLLNALAWPALAFALTRSARKPATAQFHCLVADSLLGGAWIAFIGLSMVPSAVFAALLVADKVAAGGLKLAIRSTVALAVGCAAAWFALDRPYEPLTSARTAALTLPFLFVYGIGLSVLSWHLARKVRVQNRMLQRLSRMDPLVELANRGYFIQRAQHSLHGIHQQGGAACLLMLDVDDFKRVNDSFGHRAGDEVLRRIATVLRAVARPEDTPARLGGDEFVLLLAQRTPAEAMQVAAQIRGLLHPVDEPASTAVAFSVSIGIAAAPRQGSAEDWLARADQALYEAKRQGKNTAACGEWDSRERRRP